MLPLGEGEGEGEGEGTLTDYVDIFQRDILQVVLSSPSQRQIGNIHRKP